MGWRDWLIKLLPPMPPDPPREPEPRIVRVRVDGIETGVPVAWIRLDDAARAPIDGIWIDGSFTFVLPPGTPPHGATLVVQATAYNRVEARFTLSNLGGVQELGAVSLPPAPVDPPTPAPEPEPEPPHVAGDAIELAAAQVAARDCPDVRGWPVFATLLRVTLAERPIYERGDTMVEFDGRDLLPPAYGTQGAITYTLWLGCWILGRWYILPIVECIGGYVPTGHLLLPGHVGPNLLYYADPPLTHYQPAVGEDVIMFCTTGDTRRQNVQARGRAPGRTTVLKVPWCPGVTLA